MAFLISILWLNLKHGPACIGLGLGPLENYEIPVGLKISFLFKNQTQFEMFLMPM